MAKFWLIWFSYNQLERTYCLSVNHSVLKNFTQSPKIFFLVFVTNFPTGTSMEVSTFFFSLVIFTFLFVALFYYIAHLILSILILGILEYCKAPRTINGRWRYINLYFFLSLLSFDENKLVRCVTPHRDATVTM